MVKVKVERLDKSLPLPSRQKGAASGFDLYFSDPSPHKYEDGSPVPQIINYGNTVYLPTGIRIELPPGYEAIVRGRSSLSKKGLVCSIGTIDEDYRGEIGVVLSHTTKANRWVGIPINHGDRIAQLVIQKKAEVELVEVHKVDTDTVRGEDGFGSTGKGVQEYEKVQDRMIRKWPEDGEWIKSGHRGEYNCPHGVGHGNHVHGCDGCCKRDDYPLKKARMKVLEDTIG